MNTLTHLSQKAATLKGIESILGWDQETFMPPGAAESRSEQLKLLAGLYHKAKTQPAYKKALGALIDLKTGHVLTKGLREEEKASLREWRRDYLLEVKLPKKFIEEFSQLTSQGIEVWKFARQEKNFQHFAPHLEKIVTYARKKADLLGYKEHPYDALLDLYEPLLTTRATERQFNLVEKELIPLIQKTKKKHSPFIKKLSVDRQLALSQELLHKMGYDFNHGRLDLSVHPFSSAPHPTDSRITTRIDVDNPLSNILTTLHEAGHALYEMGLPIDKWGTPLGESVSMAVHESQSRFWETCIGLSRPFWKWVAPQLGASSETLFEVVNRIEPGYIRVDADRATYPLHIILRFRLEKRLIEGSLNVRDIPEAWRQEMQTLLGLTPPDDALGALQDIHWSMGAFGYFPTYLLGTLYASHLFEKFKKDHKDWETRVAKGDLLFIKKWLNDKIHRHGRLYPPLELIERASSKPFSADAFLKQLKDQT